jgi:hypothetical protein
MRHSKTGKANTHKRIVTIAAKKFREDLGTVPRERSWLDRLLPVSRGPVSGPPGTTRSTEGEGYADVFPLAARGPGSGSSAVCARCHAASRSRRSSATSVLAISRIASA